MSATPGRRRLVVVCAKSPPAAAADSPSRGNRLAVTSCVGIRSGSPPSVSVDGAAGVGGDRPRSTARPGRQLAHVVERQRHAASRLRMLPGNRDQARRHRRTAAAAGTSRRTPRTSSCSWRCRARGKTTATTVNSRPAIECPDRVPENPARANGNSVASRIDVRPAHPFDAVKRASYTRASPPGLRRGPRFRRGLASDPNEQAVTDLDWARWRGVGSQWRAAVNQTLQIELRGNLASMLGASVQTKTSPGSDSLSLRSTAGFGAGFEPATLGYEPKSCPDELSLCFHVDRLVRQRDGLIDQHIEPRLREIVKTQFCTCTRNADHLSAEMWTLRCKLLRNFTEGLTQRSRRAEIAESRDRNSSRRSSRIASWLSRLCGPPPSAFSA